ncbi:hypothetical protein [Xanthomonas campestris]|uniref:hypothetical protein n=1 Tax=Xanthomonas campestris TaxID=339 RepID=UPI001E46C08F|nr:hypothetical protein [Xanthomonas campestris]MCC5064155.1 hypothetical protein [Xanthomonas campestris pv. raphani]MEA9890063.1 hypothetical protein [Xanthomonas campestris pv. raphani]MEA9975251.1 hypothetical protein [Xanthomonas campestris pv. raphani]
MRALVIGQGAVDLGINGNQLVSNGKLQLIRLPSLNNVRRAEDEDLAAVRD